MIETRQPPDVGSIAPAFTLKDSDMKDISLAQYRGCAVVLAFFPAAFSGVCTTELCTFQKSMHEFNEMDAMILGVSVDLPYTLRRFRQAEHLGFPLLSDFDRIVIRDYGVVDNNFHGYHSGVAQRSVFVVDADGTIAWRWISQKQGEHPEYAAIVQAVS